ncbi:MAG: EamA family transporter [Gammaproteobacteria bacterium]|nr:EamA family transporter [Gammaproteobacteria bacterium]MCP5199689.1 EamA family transporter [Gammaproteobacteria bacterium]
MELIWIPITVFAALMQAVRTAAQKTLNQRMSTLGTTYVRSLAGLPFLLTFLLTVLHVQGGGVPDWQPLYFFYTFGGALAQVVATALLIRLFTLKTFAVSSMLIKSDVLMTAVIGSLWFSESLSPLGWAALVAVLAGVIVMSIGRVGTRRVLAEGEALAGSDGGRALRIGLTCALVFTFSYLFIREAALMLEPRGAFWRAGWTVVTVTSMQVLGLGSWLALREPAVFGQLWPNRRLVGFVGLTSALGSVGWFSAFALENASYVRAVAQIEAVFTLVISWFYFKERINGIEFAGIVIVVGGVLMFRLVG